MGRRNRIGLFTAYPENTHVRRVLEGICSQCEKYDYDLYVFSPSIHFSFPNEEYVKGEANIFELANPDMLDGIIVDGVSIIGDPGDKISKKLADKLSGFDSIPKCVLDLPTGNLEVISNDNENALREQVRHVIEVHGRKKICIISGTKDNEIAERRMALYLDEIKKHGLEVLPEHIIYGDFYYFSGDALAKKIANGEIERPDAVICAGDCMAIGLVDRLVKLGVKVPEDVLVVSFDASDEAAVNLTTIASYEPSDKEMGARAVDHLRKQIEPGADITPYEQDVSMQFRPGASCGCQTDPVHAMKNFRDMLYIGSYNQADEEVTNKVGLGTFMESYVLEEFTASMSVTECFRAISSSSRLLSPYLDFYLCLEENWQDMNHDIHEGYTENMKIYVSSASDGLNRIHNEDEVITFKTSEMLPEFDEMKSEASVYYFSPVHFNGTILGYTVLRRAFCKHPVVNVFHRNWIRYLNNGLEMLRIKESLQSISVHDPMTGVYNRRGMYEKYRSMLADAKEGDALFVSVVDMDGLKYVNDTFGHKEGDFGIKSVCSTLQTVARKNEICVRSGGDEFFLIGIGKYIREDEALRASEFSDTIDKISKEADKPYSISASIGCVVFDDCTRISLDNAISEADERMYRYKLRNRRHRSV